MAEQRNPYRGPRPWLRLGFQARNGSVRHLDLVADTGCPVPVILRPDLMDILRVGPAPARDSNFGRLVGGWVRLYAPELGVVELVRAYGNDRAPAMVARTHPDFAGLVGLPVLWLGEYGGNADAFWFRHPPPRTSPP